MAANLVPLLILSDAVTAPTGLARIARDLATRIHKNLPDVFRVGTYGFGACGSRHLGFPQYAMSQAPETTEFVLPELEQVWNDFAGDERGVLLTVWDLSRLMWLTLPHLAPQLANFPNLQQFLLKKPFAKWGYLPIDADGPNGLTMPLRRQLSGFNRVLAYSEWAETVIEKTLEVEAADRKSNPKMAQQMPPIITDIDNLPHGIDTDVFFPTNKALCRKQFLSITGGTSIMGIQKGIAQNEALIGIVATNQHRKDWALGLRAVSIIKRHRPVRVWIHTDALDGRYWSIASMLFDFGLDKDAIISLNQLPDDKMAMAYSACDVTLGIGLGEGFGFPVFESLACGTPCVIANYGGAPEHGDSNCGLHAIRTDAYRYEGLYCSERPVYKAIDWALEAEDIIKNRETANLPNHLDWKHNWVLWEQWLKKGIQ